MKKELRTFLAAISYYTRIPCNKDLGQAELSNSIRYFPLIGWITGVLSSAIFIGGNALFGQSTAIILSIATSVLLTGAIHEDGFADVCDGFGGGWTKEKIMVIMKDSRVGAYGVVGLIIALFLRFSALQTILSISSNQPLIQVTLYVTAHSLSRFNASTLMLKNTYVREIENSKAAFISQKHILTNLGIGFIFAAVPFIFLINLTGKIQFGLLIVILFAVHWYFKAYFKKWIGGYTGDCLGAVQLMSEIAIYLFLIPLWKFI